MDGIGWHFILKNVVRIYEILRIIDTVILIEPRLLLFLVIVKKNNELNPNRTKLAIEDIDDAASCSFIWRRRFCARKFYCEVDWT